MTMLARVRAVLLGDGVLALLFLLLLIGYLIAATQLRGGLMSDQVGPRTFPILLGVFGTGLCAVFFLKKLRAPPAEHEAYEARTVKGELVDLIPLFILFVYVLVMGTLGYLLATFLYVTITVKLLGQRTWWGAALFAACLTLVTFALFSYVFEVSLPPGDILPSPY